MNIAYIIGLISSLFFISPAPQDGLQLVGQFNLYVDTNKFRETGKVIITWESKIDRYVYGDDCQAFYDLCQNRADICSIEELQRIAEVLKLQKQILNKL